MKLPLGKVIRRTWKYAIFLIIIIAMIDFSPLVPNKSSLQAHQAQLARSKAKMFADGLASMTNTVSLNFNEAELIAVAATLSHIFENTSVALGYSYFSLQGASSSSFDLGIMRLYLNLVCEVEFAGQDSSTSSIDYCKVGSLPIPGFIIEQLLYASTYVVFDKEVAKTALNLLTSVSVQDRVLTVNAQKSIDFKQRVNSSMTDAKSLAKLAIRNTMPDPAIIQIYLDDLATQSKHPNMYMYIKRSMQLAAIRSGDSDPVIENAAAMWAWAISMSSSRFARMADISDPPNLMHVNIRGRRDLALHFIVSYMLSQFGSYDFAYNVGELKEILDSGKGGSGYSFPDLLADKSGLVFSDALTLDAAQALRSQDILVQMTTEDDFFPFIHDVVEGLSESQMKLLFGGSGSEEYQAYVDDISQRFNNIALYQKQKPTEQQHPSLPSMSINNGNWIKVDTHVHSKYSDGSFSIADIAEKADFFGCEAIAITDHGDHNISRVLSDAYFTDITKANYDYPRLTVMPGIEWNVPPFAGREHATIILPATQNHKSKLREFRTQFDHFEEADKRFLSIKPALQWLNKLAESSTTPPLMIYNHPSRKDKQSAENQHDMQLWQNQSPFVLGMSGAPGHQRLRDHNNGSYRQLLKTVNGQDPVSRLGGEWDKLLQNGYRVLAARAASDFHNLTTSYWPCQFSSTHTFAKSNQHNDVINALFNGNTWAQHGQFVSEFTFTLKHAGHSYYPGQTVQFSNQSEYAISINMRLNQKDWQGFDTSLDSLYLVIITDTGIINIDLLKQHKVLNKVLNVEQVISLPPNVKAIRVTGKSVQPELHDFTVFSNPIMIE